MGKPNNVIIAPTTAAVLFPLTAEDDNLFYIPQGETWTISATNLGASETIGVKIWEGTAYNAFRQDGIVAALTYSDNARPLSGPGYFQIDKPATSGSVGVYKND